MRFMYIQDVLQNESIKSCAKSTSDRTEIWQKILQHVTLARHSPKHSTNTML